MSETVKIEDSFKVEYRGHEYSVSFATLDQINDHDKRMSESDEAKYMDVIAESVCKLGLDKNVANQMPPSGLMQILKIAFGFEKK